MHATALASIGAIILLIGGAGLAGAGETAQTQLTLVHFADSNNDGTSDYIIGTVSSDKRKCEGGRTVSIIRLSNGKLIDRTRTSKNGYWAGGGVEGINSIEGKVKVDRKVIGRGSGRLVCESASQTFD